MSVGIGVGGALCGALPDCRRKLEGIDKEWRRLEKQAEKRGWAEVIKAIGDQISKMTGEGGEREPVKPGSPEQSAEGISGKSAQKDGVATTPSPPTEPEDPEDDEGADEGVVNPKIYEQLEKQLARDGKGSILKALRNAEKTLKEHQDKLKDLEFKSQVRGTIRNVKNQIKTIEKFVKDKNLAP